MCWLYVEELPRTSTMIEQYQLYQLKKSANLPLANIAASDADALLHGHGVFWNEPATGPLGVNISAFRLKLHFKKFGNVIWGYHCFWTIHIFYFFPR